MNNSCLNCEHIIEKFEIINEITTIYIELTCKKLITRNCRPEKFCCSEFSELKENK